MSLRTPDKLRSLQRKLYRKAKAEPGFRFYVLYDKTCRENILAHAYALASTNAGAPGVDGATFAMIEAAGLEAWLSGVREYLVSKTYRPEPVRRVRSPKPGGFRPLCIPTIRDRVPMVQTAAKLVLKPIFEANPGPSRLPDHVVLGFAPMDEGCSWKGRRHDDVFDVATGEARHRSAKAQRYDQGNMGPIATSSGRETTPWVISNESSSPHAKS